MRVAWIGAHVRVPVLGIDLMQPLQLSPKQALEIRLSGSIRVSKNSDEGRVFAGVLDGGERSQIAREFRRGTNQLRVNVHLVRVRIERRLRSDTRIFGIKNPRSKLFPNPVVPRHAAVDTLRACPVVALD